MMLIIYGLPRTTKFADVKVMVRNECQINDFILDNLEADSATTKKIRIGVTDHEEGMMLIKRLDGLNMRGHTLRVLPVSKQGPNAPQPDGYGQPAFNQPRNEYQGPPGYNLHTSNHQQQPHWNTNQWTQNQQVPNHMPQSQMAYQPAPVHNYAPQMAPQQRPEMKYGPQGTYAPTRERVAYEQNYPEPQPSKYPAQNLDHHHVAVIDSAMSRLVQANQTTRYHQSGQYGMQEKPMTIAKDNFQGPSQYNTRQPPQAQAPYQSHGPAKPNWTSQNINQRPETFKGKAFERDYTQREKRASPPYKYTTRDRENFSPPRSPGRQRMSDRKPSPVSYDRSAPGRDPMPARRYSPGFPPRKEASGRLLVSGSKRLVSPGGCGVSPPRRLIPPVERGISPSERRFDQRGRHVSAERAPPRSPPPAHRARDLRYSPKDRHTIGDSEKYGVVESRSKAKVAPRPAYEMPANAPNTIYSGGYRPSLHENVQYPIPGAHQSNRNNWQEPNAFKKRDEERMSYEQSRNEHRMLDSKLEPTRSPKRKSRSPNRDRYRRHSPSPRSPRRSWALEKRCSPEASSAPPPPLSWPGQNRNEKYQKPSHKMPIKEPVWELQICEDDARNISQDRRHETREMPGRREPTPLGFREPKFEEAFAGQRDFSAKNVTESSRKRKSAARIPKKITVLHKEGEDLDRVHERAQDLMKRQEELRKKKQELDARRRELDRKVEASSLKYRREQNKIRNDDWKTKSNVRRAVKIISAKMCKRFNVDNEQEERLADEVYQTVSRLVSDLSHVKETSSIAEIIEIYRLKHGAREEVIYKDVVASLPSHSKPEKRGVSGVKDERPAKVPRHSAGRDVNQDSEQITAPPKETKQEVKAEPQTPKKEPLENKPKDTTKDVEIAGGDGSHLPSSGPKVERKMDVPTVEPNAEGMYELSPRIVRMLDNELRHIMIKVWQELPDDPPTEEERVVVDKLRNQAGDDLRNVLGLNVTKRLLNIYNPLHIKIVFSGKTEAAALKAFIQKYGIVALKKLGNSVNTFVGQVRTIDDFDNICTANDVVCGVTKVVVTPCYKFTQCPNNIKTNYLTTEVEKETAAKNVNTIKKDPDAKPGKENSSESVQDTKAKIVTDNKSNKQDSERDIKQASAVERANFIKKDPDSKPGKENSESIQDSVAKTVTGDKSNKPDSQRDVKQPSAVENVISIKKDPDGKTGKENSESIQDSVPKTVIDNKSNKPDPHRDIKQASAVEKVKDEKKDAETCKIKNEENIKPTNESKEKKDDPQTIKNAKEIAKTNSQEVKSSPKVTDASKASDDVTSTNKDILKTNITKNVNKSTEVKENTKKEVVTAASFLSKTKPSPKTTKNKFIVEETLYKDDEDFEELDDEDILKLMSQAIVLDECSGDE